MVGEQLREILRLTGFNMADFAPAIKRSKWFVQRLCRRGRRVPDRWVVLFGLFLKRKGLNLDDYYTRPKKTATNKAEDGVLELGDDVEQNEGAGWEAVSLQDEEPDSIIPAIPVNMQDKGQKAEQSTVPDTFREEPPKEDKSEPDSCGTTSNDDTSLLP